MRRILTLLLFCSCYTGYGQLVYNRGQIIFTQDSALIKVEGGLWNDRQGYLNHNGSLYIDSSFHNNAVTEGSGRYYVYEDWINDSSFTPGSSHVYLAGDNQLITGDSVTSFFDLTLQGTGIKTQTLNARALNRLELNNLELALGNDTMFVVNTDATSILYDNTFGAEGFVSTTETGSLVRYANSNESYFFPLGSSQGVQRFRPIMIRPQNTGSNVYSAGFLNYDTNNDAFVRSSIDNTICLTNALYYHKVDRLSGTGSTDLGFYYLKSDDGLFDGFANWSKEQNRWNSSGSVNSGVNSGYDLNEKISWNDFSDIPYIFIRKIPNTPKISGEPVVCANETGKVYDVADSTNVVFNWYIIGGELTDQYGSHAVVNWAAVDTGIIEVTVTDTLTGCTSFADSMIVRVSYNLLAAFTASETEIYPYSVVRFTDASNNAITWDWDFGFSATSEQNPEEMYADTGIFRVQLVVEDQYGCIDTADINIRVVGNCKIPNVFSPNTDGVNDVFELATGCVKDFTMTIFNRWGQKVYDGIKGSPFWDGHGLTGGECSEGTYFYVFEGTGRGEDVVEKGNITLIR